MFTPSMAPEAARQSCRTSTGGRPRTQGYQASSLMRQLAGCASQQLRVPSEQRLTILRSRRRRPGRHTGSVASLQGLRRSAELMPYVPQSGDSSTIAAYYTSLASSIRSAGLPYIMANPGAPVAPEVSCGISRHRISCTSQSPTLLQLVRSALLLGSGQLVPTPSQRTPSESRPPAICD